MQLDVDFVEARHISGKVAFQDATTPPGSAAGSTAWSGYQGQRRPNLLAVGPEVDQAHLRFTRGDSEHADRRVGRGKGDGVHETDLTPAFQSLRCGADQGVLSSAA